LPSYLQNNYVNLPTKRACTAVSDNHFCDHTLTSMCVLDDLHNSVCCNIMSGNCDISVSPVEPNTYEEAITSVKWQDAIKAEFN
ncbi:hypothetical protein Q6294_32360, partial [Klebsiella pneumoniae]